MLHVAVVVFCAGVVAGDSYLDAYQESHGTTVKSDREYVEQFPYPASQPGYQYGPPSGPSGPSAGGPTPQYGPPRPQYGPPKPQYGPPNAIHNYGPPLTPIYGAPIYEKPHAFLGLLDKFKHKLDLFTVGKILLKLVLFKKFVSFVAIICLLLFLPTLKNKVDDAMPDGDGDDDDAAMRGYGPKKYKGGEEALNNVAKYVLEAIDNFSRNYTRDGNCDGVFCKTHETVKGIDDKLSYAKLAKLYVNGEQ